MFWTCNKQGHRPKQSKNHPCTTSVEHAGDAAVSARPAAAAAAAASHKHRAASTAGAYEVSAALHAHKERRRLEVYVLNALLHRCAWWCGERSLACALEPATVLLACNWGIACPCLLYTWTPAPSSCSRRAQTVNNKRSCTTRPLRAGVIKHAWLHYCGARSRARDTSIAAALKISSQCRTSQQQQQPPYLT